MPERLRRYVEAMLAPGRPEAGTARGTELIDTAAVAAILGVSTRYVRKIAHHVGGQRVSGRWVFCKQDVRRYADTEEREPTDDRRPNTSVPHAS